MNQRAQPAAREIRCFRVTRQAKDRLPQLRSEQGWQRPPLRRLDAQRLDAGRFCILSHAIEEHGLPDSTQADHDDALGGHPSTDALGRDAHGLAQFIASGELRRRSARARREWVG